MRSYICHKESILRVSKIPGRENFQREISMAFRSEMAAIQNQTAKLARDASRQVKAEKLPRSALTAVQGGHPSLEACYTGLQAVE